MKHEAATVKKRQRLSSVANALRVMKAFSDEEPELGISALAKRLQLAKSTVHRLASTLIDAGMLEQNGENGKYHLGLAVFELGALVRRTMDISSEARPYLRDLRDQTGETIHLAVLDHASVLYINIMESRQAIRMSSSVGSRAPAYCTGDGKALLAWQPDDVVEAIAQSGMPKRTQNTITDIKALCRDLAKTREQGYAVDDEESEIGMRCVAAPIRTHSGAVLASLSISGPTHRVSRKALVGYAREVMIAASAISQRLGWQAARRHSITQPIATLRT